MSKPIVVSDLKTLRKVVLAAINEHGSSVDLNHINVGGLDDFTSLFEYTDFCGDVSQWDMARADYTNAMFAGTPFNGDLSKWNLRRLKEANDMFQNSLFNGRIDHWSPSVLFFGQMNGMFENCAFTQDLTAWRITDKCEQFELRTASLVKTHPLTTRIPTNEALRKHSVTVYAKMFGGEDHLSKYLARTPFGVMHFDACCVSQSCPAGVAPEDFAWSRELLMMGNGLGLDNPGIRALCRGSLEARNRGGLVESFLLDGVLSQS